MEKIKPELSEALNQKVENELLFKLLFEQTAVGVVHIDLETGCLIKANKRFAEMLGYEMDELLPLNLHQITHPGDLKNSLFHLDHLKKGLVKEYSIEKRYLRKDKTSLWALVSSSLGKPVSGRPFIIGIIQEISERKKAEQVLMEENQRFHSTMDAIDSIVYVADLTSYEVLFINKYCRNLFGEITGKKCYEALQGKNAPCEFCTNHLLFDEHGMPGKPLIWEFQNIKTKRWFQCHDQAINWPEGKLVRFEIATDITQDKLMREALKDSKEKLELALVSGNIGIWEWNLKKDEFDCDEKTSKMLSADKKFPGKFKDFEELINEEDLTHVKQAIAGALENDFPLDTIFRSKNGGKERKYINAKAKVYRENGKPSRLLGVNIDITEMRNATEQVILNLNEELLRSNKELQSFAYVASHDLKEPLRMVASYTQLLAQRYKDKLDKDGLDFIQFAVAGVHRMYDLINAILAYSRVQSKDKILTMVRMEDIMTIVDHDIRNRERDKEISLTWNPLPAVFADESQMMLLMQNLVSNAVKFSNEKPAVHIACEQKNGDYIFSVSDKGIGIETRYFDKIFQIFQRLHTRNDYSGTGIGLTICKRITELHGGKIWLESTPGEGSTFYFSLPCKRSGE